MELKPQILNALQNSLVADATKLKQSTQLLTNLRNSPRYCIILMEIIHQQTNHVSLKQAALVQLKNTIKSKWKTKKGQICQQDKSMIKAAILTAIIRAQKQHKLVKLYKEVLTIIITYQYKFWMPLPSILETMHKNQHLPSLTHCLIAIASSFQFSITPQQRSYYFQFLKVTLPQLVSVLDKNQTPQLIYLNLKFLWKAIHYQINDQIKILATNWMNLLLLILGMQNQQFDNTAKTNSHYLKSSRQFYYYHSKKWAMRIVLRFVQKHAKINLPKKSIQNLQYSENWYKNFGHALVELLFKQLNIPTIPKVRYFQLKCLQSLVIQKPSILAPLLKVLQYQLLPPYICLKPQDQQLANSDPIQFLSKQSQPCMNFTNLKKVASDLWISIAQSGSKQQTQKNKFEAGEFLYNSMNFLKMKLQSTSQLQKQFAMYLLCRLRTTILKCSQIKAIIPSLISTYIIPQFKNQIMFLRARAVDIFYDYGSIGFPIEVISKATQGIYLCLTQDTQPIVRIKAASAFNCILRHKEAKQLVRPLLKDILTIYLKLLQQYDIEILVNSLQSIVQDFSTEIEPFAYQLTKYMQMLFMKLYQKDQDQGNEDYANEIQLAASGCLKTITQIVDSPISQKTLQQLHNLIVQLCYFLFSTNNDYLQDLLMLLNSYLYKLPKITRQLWFFYQIIIYNITGIPQVLWTQFQNSNTLNSAQGKILENVKSGGSLELMQQSTLVLRNYIKKGSHISINNANQFKSNLLQSLLFLVGQIYGKGPSQFSGELEMICSISLLVNFLQSNQVVPDLFLQQFWNLAKYNLLKTKSKSMKTINIQLISLIIYRAPIKFIEIMQQQRQKNQKLVTTTYKQLIDSPFRVTQIHQYKRVILGLTTLIILPQRPVSLLSNFVALFNALFKLIRKVLNHRLDKVDNKDKELDHHTMKNNQQDDQYEQNDDDKMLQTILNGDSQEEDDEQDFWEERYGENYESQLEQIDQLKYFEEGLKKIQRQETVFYSQILKIVPQQQFINLSYSISTASQVFTHKK